MNLRKRGQATPATAGGAALLIVIIAAMILLYTLFLPPEDRAKLLEDTNGDENGQTTSDIHLLLKKSPGRLDLVKKDFYDHKISTFSLYSVTKAKIIKEFNSIYAEKSVFSEKPQSVMFDVNDLENTDNVLLSFAVNEYAGKLRITLNGNQIAYQEFSQTNPSPIAIPKNLLKDTNTLEFSVSSPGILFFITNKYSLSNIRIFADVTDRTGLENSQNFFITEVEKENLERSTLTFMTNCNSNDIGRLAVTMNIQRIYSGVPDCEVPIKIEISPNIIIEGDNNIMFSAEKGSFVIDQAVLRTNLADQIYPTYYFEIEEDDFKSIQNDTFDVNMSVIFVSSKDFQDVEVEINGRKFSIDNKKRIFMETIDPYVREGNNAITLRPLDGTVEIVELKVFLIEKDEDD